MDILNAKKQVVSAGIEISQAGLIARTWGNVSVRTGPDEFAITASGRNYMTLTPDEIVQIKIDDLSYEGDIKPSSEKKVHREIYKLKDDVGFVIHTHQSNASAVSAMGLKKIRFKKDYPGIGYSVPVAGYGLPGSKKLCKNTAAAVEKSKGQAVIMSNHGAVCYGKTYEDAFAVAQILEEACAEYLKNIGVEPWNSEDDYFDGELWNNSPVIMKYMEARDVLKPYLDDFAQLVGTKLDVVDDDEDVIAKAIEKGQPLLVRGRGALCAAPVESDREAISMVIEKNCRAALAALGGKPINPVECFLMRQFYLKKYSKRSE